MNETVKNWAELFIRLSIVYAVLAGCIDTFSHDKESAITVWSVAAASFTIGVLIWLGAKFHGWVTK